MRKAVRLALRRYVAINAHPSFEDARTSGAIRRSLSPEELEGSRLRQVDTLRNIVRQEEGELIGVKPHGALYHAAARNRDRCGRRAGRLRGLARARPRLVAGLEADRGRRARSRCAWRSRASSTARTSRTARSSRATSRARS